MSKTKIIASSHITLQKIYDGNDGYTVVLSNPSHTIMCDSNGDPIPGELGANGKAKCTVKVFGKNDLQVASSTPSKGQYAIYLKKELCVNCTVEASSPDTFYINTIGTDITGKVVVDVNIEGRSTIRQEMTFSKVISPDSGFGIDGKFIYGKSQWCSDITNQTPLDNAIKVVKSNQAIYGTNVLEIVGERWVYSRQPVYNNKNIIYKVNLRARITKDASNGKKECYIGCKPFDSSGNPCGPDGGQSNKNVYLWNGNLTNEWKEYTFYMGKESRPQITDINGAVKFPAVRGLPSNAVKFHPLFIVNYPAASDGIVEVDCFTLEDVTAEFETTDLKNKNVKLETDINGINASVTTIKSITDKSDNPMTLQVRVNYSAFNTENPGKIYLHGMNSDKSPADVDGVCRWYNQDITLPKTMFNPNGCAPLKTVLFIVYDKNVRAWLTVWEQKSDDGSKAWKYLDANVNAGTAPRDFSWGESTHIVVGYYIIDTKMEQKDYVILMAQLFKGALNYKQATTMSLSSSVSQIEVIEDKVNLKVDKDGVIAAINIYTQTDGNGDTTSGVKIRGDKINLQGQVTFEDLSSDNEIGLKKLFNHSNNSTTINGGFIETNSIKANSIDLLSGLTVMGEDNTPVFAVSRVEGTTDKGTVEINGLLRSGNFNEALNTGYKISPDGTAILNQAKIRGDVELPNAGITNFGATLGNPNLLINTMSLSNVNAAYIDSSKYENCAIAHSKWDATQNTGYRDAIAFNGYIEPEKDTYYTVSFLAKGTGNVKNYFYPETCVSVKNSQGKTGTASDGQNVITLTENWTRYWITYKTSSTVAGKKNIIIGRQEGSSSEFYITQIKFEKGEQNTPWCLAESEQSNFVRFWAGSNYLNRDTAPFRVMQNGDVYARNGTYEGLLRGTLDSGDVQVYNNAITIHSPGTETEVISFRAQQSIFNTDVVFGGNRDIEYLNATKNLVFNSSNLTLNQRELGTVKFNVKEVGGYSLLSASGKSEGKHRIKYWDGYGGLIFESFGSNKTPSGENPYDFKFERYGSDVNVKVQGSIEVTSKILSNKQNIEIRSVEGEGWGFFAT